MVCYSDTDIRNRTDNPDYVITEHNKWCDTMRLQGWGTKTDCTAAGSGGSQYTLCPQASGIQVAPGKRVTLYNGTNFTGSSIAATGVGMHFMGNVPSMEDNVKSLKVEDLSTSSGGPYVTKSIASPRSTFTSLDSSINAAICCPPSVGDASSATGTCAGGQMTCTYSSINESLNPGQLSQYFDQQTLDRWLNNTTAGGGGRCSRLTVSDFLGSTWSDACKTALGNDEYNLNLINRCASDSTFGWVNTPATVNALKNIIHNNATHNDLVVDLFQTFCGGSATDTKALGGHRTDSRCACINASNFGITGTSNCFDPVIKDYPGCATTNYYGSSTTPHVGLYDKFGSLVRYPNRAMVDSALASFTASPGCLVEACGVSVAGANTGDLMFPFTATACPNVNMTFCGQTINIGAAQDSPINAQQTCSSGGSPAGTPPSTPAGTPAGTPPTGSPGGTPPSTDTLWPSNTIPGIDTKNKQIGFSFFIFIMCFCCLMMIVVAL